MQHTPLRLSGISINPSNKNVCRVVANYTCISDLLSYIQDRELVTKEAAEQCSRMQEVIDRLTELEVESYGLSRQNVELAAEILRLADSTYDRNREPMDSEYHMTERAELEREVKIGRQRWKAIKGTASAIVAGSGADWVRDARLRDMVLDMMG